MTANIPTGAAAPRFDARSRRGGITRVHAPISTTTRMESDMSKTIMLIRGAWLGARFFER
jgi:hypothetical protein